MQLPEIVDSDTWYSAQAALREKEKEHTRQRDALAAERRRLPRLEIDGSHEFDGPEGRVTLRDLFEGRSQLLVYHFWHPPGGNACGGCTMFTDQVAPLAHLHARDVTFALVSTAPQDQTAAYRERMGWELPWYTTVGDAYQTERGTTEYFKLDAYVREGDRVFVTYETQSRGVEALGSVWTLLDLAPLGRQEEWEDSPEGYPQDPPYSWWRKRGEY